MVFVIDVIRYRFNLIIKISSYHYIKFAAPPTIDEEILYLKSLPLPVDCVELKMSH